MTKEATTHIWSGWPGAFCLKCGCECDIEISLADNCPECILFEEPFKVCEKHQQTPCTVSYAE